MNFKAAWRALLAKPAPDPSPTPEVGILKVGELLQLTAKEIELAGRINGAEKIGVVALEVMMARGLVPPEELIRIADRLESLPVMMGQPLSDHIERQGRFLAATAIRKIADHHSVGGRL